MAKRKFLPKWTTFERAKVPADLSRFAKGSELWVNSRYQVMVTRAHNASFDAEIVELSIKNRDKSARHDWRDLQRIKNELVGSEVEAIELYPAESRLVDTANQFFLFCFPEGQRLPVGFTERLVSDAPNPGGSQRPFDRRPADCLDEDQMLALIEREGDTEDPTR